tara:strand:+ start:537 stop:2153 length:1617 start_codon:yes stop_codon:yes gene_type:complete
MPVFEITAPDGKVYEVEGANIEGAKNAFRQMMAQNERADQIVQNFLNEDVKFNEQGFAEGFFTDPTKQYTDPTTGETVLGVTSRDRLKEEIGNQNNLMGNLRSFFIGAGNMSSGSGQDELLGQLYGQFGSSGTEAEKQKFGTELARANLEVAREQNPVATAAGEVVGGLTMPLGKAKTTLGAMGKGAAYGSAYGAAYGFGSGEENFADRYNRAMQGGTVGGLFTAASVPIFNIVRSGGNKTYNFLVGKNQKAPTLESLKQLKNKAYELVDKSGIRISPDAIDDMFFKVSKVMDSAGYVRGSKTKNQRELDYVLSAISNMTKINPNGTRKFKGRLADFEEVRKNLTKSYANSNFDPRIGSIIDEFDKVVENFDGGELVSAAREAFKTFKKVEIFDREMTRAFDKTKAAGSGGNIDNQFRQAALRIINGKDASFFSPKEIKVIRKAANGDVGTDILRLVGKLSPSGNGLMTFLNLAAITTDPVFMSASLSGIVGKTGADRARALAVDDIRQYLATGGMPMRDKVSPFFVGGQAGTYQEGQ